MNRRRALRVALAATFLAVTVPVVVLVQRGSEADALVASARAKLDAPFTDAPTLERLDARGAAADLDRALALGADDPETLGLAHLAHALDDLRGGDAVLAEGELTAARATLTSDDALADLVSAAIAAHEGRLANAETRAASAHQANPSDSRTALLYATILLDRGEAEHARAVLEVVCQDEPSAAEPFRVRGLALDRLGELAEAERDLALASRLDPHDPAAPVGLGELRRRDGRPDEALLAFQDAVHRAPDGVEGVLGRGLALAALGRRDEAARDLARASELDPHDATPWLALGDLARDAGDLAGSERLYRRGLAVDDSGAAGWVKLGNALVRARRPDEALPAFRAAIARDAALAPAHQGLGVALLALGDVDGARTELERAVTLSPDDALPRAALARLDAR